MIASAIDNPVNREKGGKIRVSVVDQVDQFKPLKVFDNLLLTIPKRVVFALFSARRFPLI